MGYAKSLTYIINGRDLAWGYAKSLLYILEISCVGYMKSFLYYIGRILRGGTQYPSNIYGSASERRSTLLKSMVAHVYARDFT